MWRCGSAGVRCRMRRLPRPRERCSDIAQALCDVARAVAVRCSDVVRCGAPTPATFSRARGEVATSHQPWATSPHRPRAGGDVATSPRPYAMSLATLLVGRGRAITKEYSVIPPPCGRPRLWCDVAMSRRQSAMSLGRLGLGSDLTTSLRPCATSWPVTNGGITLPYPLASPKGLRAGATTMMLRNCAAELVTRLCS